jgi:hypothetical protein
MLPRVISFRAAAAAPPGSSPSTAARPIPLSLSAASQTVPLPSHIISITLRPNFNLIYFKFSVKFKYFVIILIYSFWLITNVDVS